MSEKQIDELFAIAELDVPDTDKEQKIAILLQEFGV